MTEERYEELMVFYKNAMFAAKAILENIQYELMMSKTIRNPIDSISYRIKTYKSAMEKARKKAVKDGDEQYFIIKVKDIAGIRIICNFEDDIPKVAEMIRNAPNIVIEEEKDYVTYPKESGYKSLHLLTKVQIPTATKGTMLKPVEIQIRTMLQQAWSEVEHRSKYKATNTTEEVAELLKQAAKKRDELDKLFVEIRTKSGED